MGKTIIDIDTEPYLRILEQIKNNASEKNLLASLYNVFISDIVKKDLLDLFKKAEEISDEINADVFLEAIESTIKHSNLPPSFFIKIYNEIIKNVGQKEKITKALDKIEQRLRTMSLRTVDIDKLLVLINNLKREFRPYRNLYLLLLIVRERMYNIIKSHKELFIEEVSERSGKLKFKPKTKLSISKLREIENKLFGLNHKFHIIKTIDAIVWSLGILLRVNGWSRIGIIYLIEADTKNTETLWEAFVNEILAENARKIAYSGIIIPISPKQSFIYKDNSTESPLNPKQSYHRRTSEEETQDGNRAKRYLEYVEISKNTGKSEVLNLIERLFNFIDKAKHYELQWSKDDMIKFSDFLRYQLRLSDLITTFPLTKDVSLKINKLEKEIIKKLNQEFPEIQLERPLDIWILYEHENLRRRAIDIISSYLSEITSEPETLAQDILETAYILSVLGPYIQQGHLRKYVLEKQLNS